MSRSSTSSTNRSKESDGAIPSQDGTDTKTDDTDDTVSSTASAGVQMMQATTLVWSTKILVAAYAVVWFIYFINNIQQGVASVLTNFLVGKFGKHSSLPAVGLMSSLVGGLTKLPLAKVLDIWGRPQGFLFCVAILTLGLVLMAFCDNFETYATAQVFYWVGYGGVAYTLHVFIADTSSLENRALAIAYSNSPYIITAWIGGPLADWVLAGPGIAWAFDLFAIIIPAITIPLSSLFMLNYRKIKDEYLLTEEKSGRTTWQSIKHYFEHFDVIGLLLVITGFALFLIPFTLWPTERQGFGSPMIIAMMTIGISILIAFAVWEMFYTDIGFIPWKLLADRTTLGACLLGASLYISFSMCYSYLFPFLIVVNGLDIKKASYISQIYGVGSSLWSIVVGAAIRKSGRFRWLAWYFGMPVTILGVGLMIHFQRPDVSIGYVIMCQVLTSFAGGTVFLCEQTAASSTVPHEHIAVVMALESSFCGLGGAIGSAIATAVWQAIFPAKLQSYLPPADLGHLDEIVGSMNRQTTYPMGSPTRTAIIQAYGEAQTTMIIISTAVLCLSVAFVALWRDIDVKAVKQTKGNVV
ncbi:siderophore iron transporter mirB [Colletotrichum orchidophilum]|uniref:Siderophore iron transporter mirB n=1 Tax=Colletotrichum orchidophilum TaxID=1209926 RepID=A0A1G4B414_9PEZI|nr:siderophore iron transporter mirB [Colletotrichum orchidophilum]OHE96169.1 siderophore iron transporter mirB [Colletotrichum orchidophilum]